MSRDEDERLAPTELGRAPRTPGDDRASAREPRAGTDAGASLDDGETGAAGDSTERASVDEDDVAAVLDAWPVLSPPRTSANSPEASRVSSGRRLAVSTSSTVLMATTTIP